MPRRSAAELAVVANDPTAQITAIRRPRPPAELTGEQAAEWVAVVNRLPADWFPRETWPILAAYCRHTLTARHVSALIADYEKADPFFIAQYDKLLAMQERESRALTALARSMRLTQQSTYAKDKTKPVPRGTRAPWIAGRD